MALHRYGNFRVEVFYFDSPCRYKTQQETKYPQLNPHPLVAVTIASTHCIYALRAGQVELTGIVCLNTTNCIPINCHPSHLLIKPDVQQLC